MRYMRARYMEHWSGSHILPPLQGIVYRHRLHQDALRGSYWPAGMEDHMREPYAVCQVPVPYLWI